MIPYALTHEGKEHKFYIPEKVLDCFNDEFDYRFVSNCQELTDMAVAIFVGLLETPNIATGGGGGGSQTTFRGEIRTKMSCFGHADALSCCRSFVGKKPKTGLKR